MKLRPSMRPEFNNILNKIESASSYCLDNTMKNELFLAKMMILETIANGRSTAENEIREIYDKLLLDELEESNE